jgi:tight adherence protein B
MNALAPWMPWTIVGLVSLTVGTASYGFAHGAGNRARSFAVRYADGIDAPLKRMLKPAKGRLVLLGQVGAVIAICSLAVALRMPALGLLALVVLPAPMLVLRYMQYKRCQAIEAKLDSFALALANATRATPSIGRALGLLQSTLPSPLDEEIEQVLREMRVGSSVEQALLNFSWRVRSPSLDALLSGVLIAMRIGGRLSEVLETTAATLREMARLDGVLRAKTAQAKMQMWVLACLPLLIVVGFDSVKPGYFAPLTATNLGIVLLALAVLCWIGSIFLARKILAVEL